MNSLVPRHPLAAERAIVSSSATPASPNGWEVGARSLKCWGTILLGWAALTLSVTAAEPLAPLLPLGGPGARSELRDNGPVPERLQTWEGEGGRPVTPTGVDTDEASIAPVAATLS